MAITLKYTDTVFWLDFLKSLLRFFFIQYSICLVSCLCEIILHETFHSSVMIIIKISPVAIVIRLSPVEIIVRHRRHEITNKLNPVTFSVNHSLIHRFVHYESRWCNLAAAANTRNPLLTRLDSTACLILIRFNDVLSCTSLWDSNQHAGCLNV